MNDLFNKLSQEASLAEDVSEDLPPVPTVKTVKAVNTGMKRVMGIDRGPPEHDPRHDPDRPWVVLIEFYPGKIVRQPVSDDELVEFMLEVCRENEIKINVEVT